MEFQRKVDLAVKERKFDISIMSDSDVVAGKVKHDVFTSRTPAAIPIAAPVFPNPREQHVNNNMVNRNRTF
uniref:Uncharacterized protein n=1 Tax=Solanum lycopersicum TaxID=4081 RepID=A0A3Q7EWW4_SOLLC